MSSALLESFMNRYSVFCGILSFGFMLHAAQGQHIARATLQARTGATVAVAEADASGKVRFTNVPPGEYRVLLTNGEGRTVTIGDLDGDGSPDLVVGGGSGKVSMQDLSMTKGTTTAHGGGPNAPGNPAQQGGKVSMQDMHFTKQSQGATFGEKTPSGSPTTGGVVSPRDAASGLPTGKRMHKPIACLVDWSGQVQGGFQSEMDAQAAGQRLAASPAGRCVVKVLLEPQAGTIEIQSFSWGLSQSGSGR